MTMFKKNGGFTLVELIVVIAILAILAGVAIPAYSGYIKKAQDVNVVTELDAITTAVQAANATAGEIDKIDVDDDGKTILVDATKFATVADFQADFVIFYGAATVTATDADTYQIVLSTVIDLAGTSYEGGATWEAGKWTAK